MASNAPTPRPNGQAAGAPRGAGALVYGGASGDLDPADAGGAEPGAESGEPAADASADADAGEAGRERTEAGDEGAAAASGAEPGAESAEPAADTSADAGDADAERRGAEAARWSSLDEIFAAAEIEPDTARGLPVRVKVNGRESNVPLGELVSSYQVRSAADQRLAEAKEKAQSLDQELAQRREAAEANLHQTAKLLERAESQLDQETRGIDWAALRKDDPDEYAAKKVEIGERRAELDKLKREAQETYRQEREQQETQLRERLQQRQAEEQKRLFEAVPEWNDAERFKADSQRLHEYLKGQGFADQEIATAADHRLIVMARKAMLYDQGQRGAAAKRVAKAPRTLRPGARGAPAKPKAKTREERWYGRP